jgi:hypothetical protein
MSSFLPAHHFAERFIAPTKVPGFRLGQRISESLVRPRFVPRQYVPKIVPVQVRLGEGLALKTVAVSRVESPRVALK